VSGPNLWWVEEAGYTGWAVARTDYDALAEQAEALRKALRAARPYVFNRITPANDEWRSQAATITLAEVDAVLRRTQESEGRTA
jgi:hypothetical protein